MKKQLLSTLENARKYTLHVAGAMPAADYHFKPASEVWTFNELMHHIGYGIRWWHENYILQLTADWNPSTITRTPKATQDYLSAGFDLLEATLQKTAPDEKAVIGFYATLDHITHHRGQATVYLRCKGITPPEYTY
ncbi:MAG TPA: DinB family protein [Chitinophaga sp.]|uniref:DinB family protein n=1 Tax=Chitinophaga sp. TaxID=1869181 RepID=UPI002CD8C8E6|nr:DinB family protein [Chitinophaga sp.]HVI44989.1 DinB family protein [Chitinophaga sp.]